MKTALFALALVGCAGADSPEIPGQEGRIDGSVWQDGIFRTDEDKQEFCLSEPDAWFCNQLGTAEQA